jgi:uncharacterized sulfatase
MLSEGGIRVPFVVHWKGQIAGGRVYRHPVISLDVAATAIALAGLPEDPNLDGVNLLPFLIGDNQAAPHETLYWRWVAQSAIREGKWKYLRGGARDYLFDVEADREETENLLMENPEIAKRLSTKLARWSEELSPPGLETKQMSPTWERYFDHYLDGKLVPNPSGQTPARNTTDPNVIDGWVVRQCSVELTDEGLRVRANSDRVPFIAMAKLDLPTNTTAVVRLRTRREGEAGIGWREAGQKDFPDAQVSRFPCKPTSKSEEYRVKITAAKNVIHVRFWLPASGADIESIAFENESGTVLHQWRFNK